MKDVHEIALDVMKILLKKIPYETIIKSYGDADYELVAIEAYLFANCFVDIYRHELEKELEKKSD